MDDLLKIGKKSGSSASMVGNACFRGTGHLVVGSIFERGPAANAGVQPGDVLEQVEDKPVKSLKSFIVNYGLLVKQEHQLNLE